MSEDTTQNIEPTIIVKRSRRSRLGCGIVVILWSLFLLLPGLCFVLAVQGELAIWRGAGIPEQESHPLVQIKLLMDADSRGVSITRSNVAIETEDRLCVQTDVSFLLWQGKGEDASYCECYVPEGTATSRDGWFYSESIAGACE